jgi:hypothetical protein
MNLEKGMDEKGMNSSGALEVGRRFERGVDLHTWHTYHTTSRPNSFAFTPELIPPPLDVVHAINDDNGIPSEGPFDPRKNHPSRLLLRSSIVIHRPRMGGIV